PERDAPLPFDRTGWRNPGVDDQRSRDCLSAGVLCAEVCRLARRISTDLVHGGAQYSPGDLVTRGGRKGTCRAESIAIHTVLVCSIAEGGFGGAREQLQCSGDRIIWFDGVWDDRLQSAPSRQAQGWLGRSS